jgi:hypothetical protein
VLHSTILNIDASNLDLTKIAIQALLRAIPLTKENFAVEDQRVFIFEGLLRAANMNHKEIQDCALEAIAEIPIVGYEQIDKMLPQIGDLTLALLASDRTDAIKRVLYFWINLAEVEYKYSHQGCS